MIKIRVWPYIIIIIIIIVVCGAKYPLQLTHHHKIIVSFIRRLFIMNLVSRTQRHFLLPKHYNTHVLNKTQSTHFTPLSVCPYGRGVMYLTLQLIGRLSSDSRPISLTTRSASSSWSNTATLLSLLDSVWVSKIAQTNPVITTPIHTIPHT